MSFPPEHLRADLVRSADEFGLTRRLGAGKFSDVFEAVDVVEERRISEESGSGVRNGAEDQEVDPRTLVVIKCLKPVSDRKVRRELLVLTHASSLPNLARFLGVVVPDVTPQAGAKAGMERECAIAAGRAPSGSQTVATGASVSSRARSAATMPSLILEHAGRQSRWLCHGRGTDSKQNTAAEDDDDEDSMYLSAYEIKYYLFHLLVALDALHSRGVMHRDVKPRNTLINRSATYPRRDGLGGGGSVYTSSSPPSSTLAGERNSLMLVDLGLADFYLPGHRYNVRVASRHYKAPELLVGNEYYDYSVDLWGVGCIFAGLLFRREPFFRGRDNVDQLAKIVAVLGPNDLADYCRRVGIELSAEVNAAVLKYASKAGPHGSRRPWHDFVAGSCPEPGDDALDLLDQLLVYDHLERYTAREAMAHRFFDDVRGRVKDEIRMRSRERQATVSTDYGDRENWRKYAQAYRSTK